MTIQRRVLILLAVSVWINYIDRGSLSVAAPDISRELNLDPSQLGVLLSAFFWTYSFCQILSGYLVDRYPVKWVFAIGFVIWTGSTIASGFTTSFASLFAMRLLLGVGESVAFPSYSRVLSSQFIEQERGLANGVLDAGTKVGPAFGNFLGVLLPSLGWRGFFIGIGGLSFLWLFPWLAYAPVNTGAKSKNQASPGIAAIIRRRQAWATFAGLFGFNYAFYFLVTWLPSYLTMERKFSTQMMSIFSAVPFLITGVVAILCGWLSDRLIRSGGEVSRVRKVFAVTGLITFALMLPGATLPSEPAAVAFAIAAFIGMGVFTSNVWAITQTLAGPSASGQWTGLQNCVGNMGGVVAPIVTGLLVKHYGSFHLPFLVASAMLFMSAACYALLAGRIEPVDWTRTPRTQG